jgi:RNA polymerase sigma factor (sigma-70 family)
LSAQSADAEAIGASRRDPARFRDVFERYYDDIRRYLQRRAGLDAGEELAAQTFEEAFKARARFDLDRESARPWLVGIASNLLRHHFRAEAARLRALERSAWMAPSMSAEDPEARLDAQAVAPAIVRVLAEMNPGERDVLLLFAWMDLSYQEIADALGVPPGTVRSRLHRARARLREPASGAVAIGGDER